MRDRVRPPRELEEILDQLKDKGVFETKQKGMMFAAGLGCALDRTKTGGSVINGYGEGIRLQYFQRSNDDGYIDAVAVAHAGQLEILHDDRTEERLSLFEQYAHAGLKELRRRLDGDKRTELEIICELIDDLGGLGADTGSDGKVKRLKGLV